MSTSRNDRTETAPPGSTSGEAIDARTPDGVICFGGEDWWYHNRGHFDMQMMRRFARRMPVLYVNSIGMRVPSPGEGRMFFTRIGRKLRSLRRGFVRVEDNFAVLSTPVLPGGLGLRLTSPWLVRSVRAAAAKMGIRRPLLWVACPTAAPVVDRFTIAGVLYQRTDRYERFHGVDVSQIRAFDRWLKARADLTIFCSSCLEQEERDDCRTTRFIDHGVDYERFVTAGDRPQDEPEDLAPIGRPRIGFIGGIDAHTFDPELLIRTARRLPDAQFVLVGGCSLPDGWCAEPNIHLLGQKPYESVARHMAGCDVLIMPWRKSSWIGGCNPVKLKEYLATGRPIVSTPFPELKRYGDLVRIAENSDEFAERIVDACGEAFDPGPGRQFIAGSGWTVRAAEAAEALREQGVCMPDLSTSTERSAGATIRLGGRTAAIVETSPQGPERAPQRSPLATHVIEPAPMGPSPLKITPDDSRNGPADRPGRALRERGVCACIMLAGGLRPSPIVQATGRSVLDLWIGRSETVLGRWIRLLDELRTAQGRRFPTRAIHDAVLPPPWPLVPQPADLRFELEPAPLRGPAGILRDVCLRYPDDAVILVVEAARAFTGSLAVLAERHVASCADITVAANADGSPAGIYFIRRSTLGVVPAIGFMDLKEQWLGRAQASGSWVRVERLTESTSHQLRTPRQVLEAARSMWGSSTRGFSLICERAQIMPGAVVRDSVVMPGAVIESDATVNRSLICPKTRVQAGSDIADAVITADLASAEHCAQATTLNTAMTES